MRFGISFSCQRCEINICDPCLPLHLRQETRYGHDVVNYNSKQENESFNCDLHPRNTYFAYCKTCETPNCSLCFAVEHKSHKISELPNEIEFYYILFVVESDFRHSKMNWKLSCIISLNNCHLNPHYTNRGKMKLQSEEKSGTN